MTSGFCEVMGQKDVNRYLGDSYNYDSCNYDHNSSVGDSYNNYYEQKGSVGACCIIDISVSYLPSLIYFKYMK